MLSKGIHNRLFILFLELETSKESPKGRHKDEAQSTKKKTDKANQKPLLPTRRSTRKRSLVFISSELADHQDKNDSRKRKRKGAEEMEETLVCKV